MIARRNRSSRTPGHGRRERFKVFGALSEKQGDGALIFGVISTAMRDGLLR